MRRLRGEFKAAPALVMLHDSLPGIRAGQEILRREYVAELGRFLEDFRNAAAHTGVITLEKAKSCRKALLEGPSALFHPLLSK